MNKSNSFVLQQTYRTTLLNVRTSSIGSWLADNFLCIINISMLISTFLISFRQGIAAAVIIIVTVIANPKTLFTVFSNKALLAYIVINILTGIAYLFNRVEISVYFAAISSIVIPMLLFGVGGECAKEKKEFVFRKMLMAAMVVMVIGLVFYFFFENLYTEYFPSLHGSGTSDWNFRFGSYISPLPFSVLCPSATCLYFICFHSLKKIEKIYIPPIVLISTFITMQRGAWITVSLAVIGCMWIYCHKSKKISRFLLALVVGLIIVIMAVHFFPSLLTEGQYKYFLYRLEVTNLTHMFARINQLDPYAEIIWRYPLGYGLGAATPRVRFSGGSLIDINYIRIFVETGLAGLLLFLVICIKALRNSIKCKRLYITMFIAIYMLHALGGTDFDHYFSSFIFWFVLGYATYFKNENSG